MPQSRKRRAGKRKSSYAASQRKAAQGGKGGGRGKRVAAVVVVLALAAAGAAYVLSSRSAGPAAGTEVTTASGLRYTDLVVGTGASPEPGRTAVVHYTGTLTDGTKFDSSRDRGQPLDFPVGAGRVIRGWEEGVLTMKVGGRRRLVIPPALGYGERGSPPKIPPNSTLVFDIELLEVR